MSNPAKTLFQLIKEANIPYANHYSDLYFQRSEVSIGILRQFPLEHGNTRCFVNQAAPHKGETWMDVPFAYIQYWETRQGKAA